MASGVGSSWLDRYGCKGILVSGLCDVMMPSACRTYPSWVRVTPCSKRDSEQAGEGSLYGGGVT
jgi:hypothetical protein